MSIIYVDKNIKICYYLNQNKFFAHPNTKEDVLVNQPKKVGLIFTKLFKNEVRENSNSGVMAANHFWPKVIRSIEKGETARELLEDRVLKEHFAIGYASANQLKDAYGMASEIKVVHAIDSRGLPTVKALFFREHQTNRFYEFEVTFCPESGFPLLAGRAFQNFHQLAA